MDFESLIKNSNTIFSTMVCPECGRRLHFESVSDDDSVDKGIIEIECTNEECLHNIHAFLKELNTRELCAILNNNGINSIITSK